MSQKTILALIARGFDETIARTLTDQGYTIAMLKQLTVGQLSVLGITGDLVSKLDDGTRPPVPTDTLNSVLYNSGFTCCVCHEKSAPIIVHHIIEWAESKNHDSDNLAVLCLNCHGKAHSKSTISLNLDKNKIIYFKTEWEKTAKGNPDFRDKIRTFDSSNIQLLKQVMSAHIKQELDNKLKATEYVPMDMEYGIIPEKKDDKDREQSQRLEHGREWQKFNIKELLPLKKKYILSSTVGMGKTTFVYHLAGLLLEKDYLPLVFTCQQFETACKISLAPLKSLKENLADTYSEQGKGTIKREAILNLFESGQERIVIIFDGLDQITSDNHNALAADIVKACSRSDFLITSRPSAVNYFESRKEYGFLRLQLFSQKGLTAFFGDLFDKAKELTQFAPDLIRTPMLAYMVKELIENGKAEGVRTRTELYEKFIEHIVKTHNIEKYNSTLAWKIERSLAEISYTALAEDTPYIQKIPVEHCNAYLKDLTCEELTTYGLVNLVVEKSDSLYFTHQSFQDYFATCYVKDKPECIDKVINEMWHPKWLEVIKFLAGFLGIDFVRKIYSGKDNVIHSRLFLAIECVGEIGEKEGEFVRKLRGELEKIPYKEPFEEDTIKAQLILNNDEFVLKLLRDDDPAIRSRAAEALGKIGGNLPVRIITKLVTLLRDPNPDVNKEVSVVLGNIGGDMPMEIVIQLVALLSDPDHNIRLNAMCVLRNVGWDIPVEIITQLLTLLHEPESGVGFMVAETIGNIGANLPIEITIQIVTWLHDPDSNVRYNATCTLREIGVNLPEEIGTQLGTLLFDSKSYVRSGAAKILEKIGRNLSIKTINRLGTLLHDPDADVRSCAVYALENIGGNLPAEIIINLGILLREQDSDIRCHVAYALGNTKVNIPAEIIIQLVTLLRDPVSEVCSGAAFALANIGENLSTEILTQLVTLLRDPDSEVCSSAADVLANIGGNLPAEIIIQLVALLRDPESNVFSNVFSDIMDILVNIGRDMPSEIITQLANMLHDPKSDIRAKAAYALGNIGMNLHAEIIIKLGSLLYDPESIVRSGAVFALSTTEMNLPMEIITQLGAMLCDPESDIRIEAVAVLGNAKGNLPTEIINQLGTLLHDQDINIFTIVVYVLGNIGWNLPTEIVTELVNLLLDPSPSVRYRTADALGNTEGNLPTEIVIQLVTLLYDQESNVRSSVAYVLGKMIDKIPENLIKEIEKHLNHANYRLLKQLYASGRHLTEK